MRAEQTLREAEAHMVTNPSMADSLLSQMPQPHKQRLRAKRGLLMAEAAYRSGQGFVSDSLSDALAAYYADNPNHQAAAKAHLLQGVCAMRCGQQEQAIKRLCKAYAEAEGEKAQWVRCEARKQLVGLLQRIDNALPQKAEATADNLLQQAQMQQLKEDAHSSGEASEFILSALVLSLFCIAVGCYVFYKQHRKRTLSLLRAKSEHLDAARGTLASLEERLSAERQQMEQREAELQSAIARHTATAAEAAQLANQLATTLQEHERLKHHMLESDEVVRKLRLLGTLAPNEREKRHREFRLNAAECERLCQAVDRASANFTTRLQQTFPALTDADVLLCVLLRLKLAPSDVAYLCGCSEETLRKRKFRLKKEKLMLPSDGQPLEAFLLEF